MIRAKVTNIEPDSVHNGNVYTQTVTIEVSDGTEYELFDTTVPDASKDDVGEIRDLEVVALPRYIREVQDPEVPCSVTPRDDGYEILGCPLNSFSTDDDSVGIKTNIGTLSLALAELQEDDIKEQRCSPFHKLETFAYRLDLKRVSE